MQVQKPHSATQTKGGSAVKTNITVGGAALRLFLALALVLGLMPSLQTTHAFAETSANTATTATEQQAGSDTSADSATEGDDSSETAADTETAGQAAESSNEAAEETATPTYHKDSGAVLTADTVVAKIGDTEYTTLAAAFAAINDGSATGNTIVLQADLDDVHDIQVKKSATLDMNGHKITSDNLDASDNPLYTSSDWYDVFWVTDEGTVFTLTGNGTIQGPTDDQAAALNSCDMIAVGNGAKFVMVNGTIQSGTTSDSKGLHGVYVYNNASAVFGVPGASNDDLKIENCLCAVGGNNTQPTANVTIYSGTYISKSQPDSTSDDDKHASAIYMPSSGTLDIQGGSFTGQHAISTPYKTTTQTISVSGGASLTSTNGTEVIKEGSEKGKTTDGVDEDYKEDTDNRTATVADATVTGTLDNKFVAEGYVAEDNGTIAAHNYWEVNGVQYNTLLKALAAARAQGSGQTIKLLEDYTCKTDSFTTYLLPEGSTLDLNGKTLTLANKASAVFEGENITIENGTINSDASYPIWIGNGESYTTATVKNITSNGGANVFAASATFEDCNFDASDDQFYALYTDEVAKITVKSGTYKGGIAGFAVCADPGSEGIFVEGGAFDYTSALANNGKKGDTDTYYDDNISVSGGSFKTTLPEKVLADNYKVVQNSDGTYGVEAIYEAKIGTTGYETLAAAIEAASTATTAAGKVITLAANVNDFEGATISSDMTIDFGDYTVTGGTGKTAFTITGGNVTFTSSTGNGGVNGGTGGDNRAVKVSGGTLNIDSGNYTVGTDADGNGNATIEVWETGKVNISGGHFSTAADRNGWYYVLNKQNDATGTFTVSGGTFENYDPAMGDDADHSADSSFCAEGYRTTKLADGSYGMTTDPVATVGGQNFLTLKAAFDAVNNGTVSDGSTITLLDDVKEVYGCTLKNGKTATLDMQGHTVTSDYSTNYSPDSKDTTSYRIFAVTDGAKLTIEGNGTIQGPESGSAACSSSDQVGMLLVQGTDSQLTIKNGTIQTGITNNKGLYALAARDGATLTLGTEGGDGPTVTSGRAAIGENHQRPASNVTVYSGTYTGLRTGGTLDDPDYEATAFLATASGTKNIYGGTFIGTNAFVTRYSDNNQTINIKGGNFQSDGGKAILVGNETGGDYDKTGTTPTRTTAVSGGTFTTEVDAEICAEGYAPTKYTNGDGKTVYGVTENYVAKIGDTTYTTLKAAVEAASDNDTIVLLQDISDFAGVEITSKTLTIDFDKYTITGKEGTDEVSVLVVGDGAKVTLKSDSGLGGINGGTGGDKNAVKTTGSGEVTILSGTYTVGTNASDGGNSTIKLCGTSKVNIEGGTFSTEAANNGKYLVLDMESNATGKFTVTAGNFVGQNPEDGDDTLGGTFCASGYHGIVVDIAEDGTITYTVTPNEDKTDDDNGVATLKDVKFTITYAADKPTDTKVPLGGVVVKKDADGNYTFDLPEGATGKEVLIKSDTELTGVTFTVTETETGKVRTTESTSITAGLLYPVVYTITYVNDKGALPEGKTNPTTYKYGTGVAEADLLSPSLDKYTFEGWYEDYECTGTKVTSIGTDKYGDITLYAKWRPYYYTVKYEINAPENATTSGTMADQVINYGDSVKLTKNGFACTGYTFTGWQDKDNTGNTYTDEKEVKNLSETDEGVIALQAQWMPDTYDIVYNVQEGVENSVNDSTTTYTYGTGATIATPTRTGYNFIGWFKDYNCSEDQALEKDTTDTTKYVISKTEVGTVNLFAKWEAKKYKVKFEAGTGGTGSMDEQELTYAQAEKLSANEFTNQTATFAYWLGPDNKKYSDEELVLNLSEGDAVTLTAQWAQNPRMVTFNTDGGKETIPTQTVEYDTLATKPYANPTKDGYEFDKWVKVSGETETDFTFESDKVIEDITLKAKWKLVTYNITYKDIDDDHNPNKDMNTYNFESDEITLKDGTNKDGYTFVGWKDADGNDVTKIAAQSTGDKVFTAQWTPIKYKVRFAGNGNTNTDASMADLEVTYDEPIQLTKNAFVKTGNTFDGWTTTINGVTKTFADKDVVKENLSTVAYSNEGGNEVGVVTLTAKWVADTYDIVYNLDADVTRGADAPNEYTYGTETVIPEPTRDHYTFAGWYKDYKLSESEALGKNAEDKYVISNTEVGTVSLFAKWEAEDVTVTFNPNGATGEATTQTFDYGTVVNLDANTFSRNGYEFKGWAGSSEDAANKTVKYTDKQLVNDITASTTLFAVWEPIIYNITYKWVSDDDTPDEVTGVTNNADNPTTYTIETDNITSADLKEPTKVGYKINAWDSQLTVETEGSLDSDENTAIKKGSYGDVTIVGTLEPITYTVKFKKGDADTGDDTNKTQEFTYDTAQDLTKVETLGFSKTGYHFDGWTTTVEGVAVKVYDDGANVLNALSTDGATLELTATWALDDCTVHFVNADVNTEDVHEATEVPDQGVKYGDKVTKPYADPTRADYRFAGWYPTDECDGNEFDFENTTVDAEDFYVYAKWVKQIKFTYQINDEVTGNIEKIVDEGSAPEYPTVDWIGHHITKWTADGAEVAEDATFTTDTTFEATWAANKYNITFAKGNDAATGDAMNALTGVEYDAASTTLPDCTFKYTGHHFTGWKDADGNIYTAGDHSKLNLTNVDGNTVELTATWAINTYTVHFAQGTPNTDYDETVTGNMVDQVMTYDEAATLYKNSYSSNGYKFTGWKATVDGVDKTFTDGQADVKNIVESGEVTLVAQWEKGYSEYQVTLWQQKTDLTGYELVNTLTYDDKTREMTTLSKETFALSYDGFEIKEIQNAIVVPEGAMMDDPDGGDGQISAYPTEVKVLYDRVKYTASFMLNYDGASTTPFKTETKEYGLTFDNPTPDENTAPTRTGYTFSGWYKDKACTDPWDFSNDTMPYVADATANPFNLYAKWTVNPCKVTFDANANGDTSVTQLPDAVTVDYGSTVEKKPNAVPQRNGYEFKGWYKENTCQNEWTFGNAETENVTKVLNEDTHVYAKWDKVSYTITYAGLEGTTTTSPTTYNIEDGVTAEQLIDPTARTGYTFASWSDPALTVEGAGKIVNEVEDYVIAPGSYGNITVTASWTAHTYNVNLAAGGGEFGTTPAAISATFDGTDKKYPTAESVKLTREGYTFAGWTDASGAVHAAGDTIENLTADDDADVTVTAKWTANTYTVVFNANGGTGTVDNKAATYDATDDAVVNYPSNGDMAKANYDFVGWSTDPAAKEGDEGVINPTDPAEGTAINNLTSDPNGVVTVYAVWKAHEYTITYTINGNAIEKPTGDDANEESYTVESGEITLNAPVLTSVLTGFYVTGWKDANGQVVASIPAGSTGNIELFGYYEGEPVNIVFTPGNDVTAAEVQNMPAVENLKYGDSLTTPDEPTRVGYDFAGWAVSGSGNMKDLSTLTATPDVNTATRDENGTLYMEFPAAWTPKTNTKYIVKYEREDLTTGNYPTSLTEVVEGEGPTGDTITVTDKTYDGFTRQTDIPTDVTIAGDGSTVIELKYTRNAYTVSYNLGGHGTEIDPDENVKFESQLTAPETPTDDSATFDGWYDQTLTYKWNFDTDTMPAKDLTLYAKWNSDKTYEVSFVDEDGNTTDIPTQKVSSGAHATKPYAAPEKAGYTCDYWYDADDTTQAEFKFEETGITKAYTLKPHYTANENTYYQVLHVYKGINDTPDIQKLEQGYGTTDEDIVATPEPRDGFEVESTATDTIKGDGTGEAKITYKRLGYTLSFESTGDAVAKDMPTSTTVTYGDNIDLPATPTADGYNFEGWYTDLACQFKADFTELTMPAKDTTLYVKWSKKTYTVHFNTNEGTIIPDVTVTDGDTVARPYADPTKTNCEFGGWFSDAACTKEYDFSTPVTGEMTIYAKLTVIMRTVTFNTNGGSSIASEQVVNGEKVAQPVNPTREGSFVFRGWYTDAAFTNAYDFDTAVTANVTLYAKWLETEVMYRLYNPYTSEHLYTADEAERDFLPTVGWEYEGIAWIAPKKSNTPVYRVYNANTGDHHYTTSTEERDVCVANGWTDEGIGWYSDDDQGVTLMRLFNPYAQTGTHLYTTDKKEVSTLVKGGWRDEGNGWFGVKE